jgi:hypothetical protein
MAAKRGRHKPAIKHFYPQNRRRTYLGDVRAAPFVVGADDESARPYFGLWVDADTGEVVSTVVAVERPAEALAEALVNPTRILREAHAALDDTAAGAVTVVDAYELPGRAVVFDPALVATLRPRLASRGVALETSERIDFFEELLGSLFEHMAAAAAPPELDLPREALAPLCAAAERLWIEKPWRYCYDEPPIGVEPLDHASRPVYAVVLGRGGEVFGLALYSSLEDYEALLSLGDPPPDGAADALAFGGAIEAAHRHRTYLVSFDQKAEVDPGYLDQLAAAGWSRRRRVVPSFVAHGGRKPTTLFVEAEARRFAPVLDAVTVFCQQARDRIAELDYLPIQLVAEVTVPDSDGPRRFRVTMPPDEPKARRGRRRQRASSPTERPGAPEGTGASAAAPTGHATGIDDPAAAARLIDQMRAHLPIPARATPELVRALRPQGLRVGTGHALRINELFYMGDEGGICCDVTPAGGAPHTFVVSLTHLRIAPSHPLFQEIRAYQRERVRRIAASER